MIFFFAIVETVSELIYTPKGERDYGTLACWGRNSIGKQSEPCLFQVVPAGKFLLKEEKKKIIRKIKCEIYTIVFRKIFFFFF